MQQYSITSNDADQRLDKFIKKLFPNAGLNFIYKLVRTDKIKVILVDGKKTKQEKDYKLQVGEIVQVYLQDEEIHELKKNVGTKDIQALQVGEKLSKKDIVYEDESLLLINKSAGINVHPGDNKTIEISLIQQVQDYYGKSLSSLTFQPSLVHRIDRDTSGLIMIAKQKEALTHMSEAFQKKDVLKKVYFALVLGKLSRQSGTIKKNLKRIENAKNENKVQVSDTGQEAITHYTLLEEFTLHLPQGEQMISALEITIETGRMHQIRVHLAHIGNPILGDKTYGEKKLNGYFAKNYGVTRHMLHAWKLQFFHPITHRKMNLTAKFKDDMENFIRTMKK